MVGALGAELVEVSSLCLGEDHISDLLSTSWGSPSEVRANLEYMQALIQFMHETGQPPNTERLEVNAQGVVTSGNHRVLAAWLLQWSQLWVLRGDQVAGWRVPLDEGKRLALEDVLELSALLGPRPSKSSGSTPTTMSSAAGESSPGVAAESTPGGESAVAEEASEESEVDGLESDSTPGNSTAGPVHVRLSAADDELLSSWRERWAAAWRST
mmetsp:Transcript_90686/g.228031  ORF Transcript_90686/g.228031 Transcript_90686/m.228031 type:complete len:213 (-) Transcript_90686:61-699(-)